MGCAPNELGERLTAEEFGELQTMWIAGELQ